MNKQEYRKIKISQLKKTSLRKLLKDIGKDLETKNEKFKDWLAENIFEKLFEKLFQEKLFREICDLAGKLEEPHLIISDCLFEVAYSFNETDNTDRAEFFYNKCLKLYGESPAVLNNLGVIFEKRGDLEKSRASFQKAKELNPEEKLFRDNYSRVKEAIVKAQQDEKDLENALRSFKTENSYIQNKFLIFCSNKRTDGLITCSYRQLPQFLQISAQKAPDVIKDWMSKKYVSKIMNPDPSVSVSVYKVNPYIEKHLSIIEDSLKKEKELLDICNNLNTASLDLIGYNSTLENQLDKISNQELRKMLERDLKENAIAIITKSFKSSLVLSGSIIEAVLFDRLKANNVKTVEINRGKKKIRKKLEDLDLNELLKAAKSNEIIEDPLLHLSHGARGFRNLIHPGVEYRKKSIEVTQDNANLIWSIVKKVLFEIK